MVEVDPDGVGLYAPYGACIPSRTYRPRMNDVVAPKLTYLLHVAMNDLAIWPENDKFIFFENGRSDPVGVLLMRHLIQAHSYRLGLTGPASTTSSLLN